MDMNLESGAHSPEEWVRLIYTLQATGFSGTLTLKATKKGRYFLFLRGHLIDFWSDYKEETLARSLVSAQLVAGNSLTDLSDAEAEITIVAEGLVAPQDLEKHHETRLQQGLQTALSQRTGTWTLTPNESLDSVDVSPALLPVVDLWDVLWKGTLATQNSGDLLAWCGIEGRYLSARPRSSFPLSRLRIGSFSRD